jgi:hypothetical protein
MSREHGLVATVALDVKTHWDILISRVVSTRQMIYCIDLNVITLLFEQCRAREGSLIFWLTEAWIMDHANASLPQMPQTVTVPSPPAPALCTSW